MTELYLIKQRKGIIYHDSIIFLSFWFCCFFFFLGIVVKQYKYNTILAKSNVSTNIPPGSKNSKKFCRLFYLRTFWDYSHREVERIVLEVYCTGDVLHWRCIALGISERTLGADWSDDKVAKSMLRPSRRETGPKPFPLHRLLRALSSCRKRLIFKKKGMMD